MDPIGIRAGGSAPRYFPPQGGRHLPTSLVTRRVGRAVGRTGPSLPALSPPPPAVPLSPSPRLPLICVSTSSLLAWPTWLRDAPSLRYRVVVLGAVSGFAPPPHHSARLRDAPTNQVGAVASPPPPFHPEPLSPSFVNLDGRPLPAPRRLLPRLLHCPPPRARGGAVAFCRRGDGGAGTPFGAPVGGRPASWWGGGAEGRGGGSRRGGARGVEVGGGAGGGGVFRPSRYRGGCRGQRQRREGWLEGGGWWRRRATMRR